MKLEILVGGNLMEEENKDTKKETIEWIKSILMAVIIAVLIKSFIFNTTYVLGNSMYPTLHEKDRLFANKVPLYFTGPSRGDVVVLEAPDSPDKDYIKRVIGLEGDKVEIIDGIVRVNDNILVEDYIDPDAYTHIYEESIWQVPQGQVFVLGDNRDEGASKDSRYFGCISIKSIKGITGFRYFPFNQRFGKLD